MKIPIPCIGSISLNRTVLYHDGDVTVASCDVIILLILIDTLNQYSSFILYTNYMVATDQAEQNFLTFS